MKLNLLLGIVLFAYGGAQAQSMAINSDGSTADGSALLDVKSSTKGVLVPRMTKTEKNSIASPATGLMVYQTGPDSTGFHYYSGSQWTWIGSTATAWQLTGNAGTNPASNFIGTTDNNPLVFRTQNTEVMRMNSTGVLGIGTATPNSSYGVAKLEIASEGVNAPADLLVRNAANSSGYAPGLVFQHARGTLAAPLAVTSGDYLAGISSMQYDGANYTLSAGLDIYADGAVSAGVVPTRLEFLTMNTAGSNTTRLTIKNDGKVGIGTNAPFSLLANNNSNNGGSDGVGLNTNSIDWSMNMQGYVMGLYNAATGGGANGLLIKAAGTGSGNRLLDVSTGSTQNAAGTAVFVVRGNSTVGIATGSPHSTLQVNGTFAVSTSMNVVGGAMATPAALSSYNGYIGLSPTGGNDYYELPDPATCPGRIYYIRNNNNPGADYAYIRSAGSGQVCNGSGACLGAGNYYTITTGTPNPAPKTVICISDGTNWTVGKID